VREYLFRWVILLLLILYLGKCTGGLIMDGSIIGRVVALCPLARYKL